MGTLLKRFAAQGIAIETADAGNVRAHGRLTDELRTAIRANKAALLEELAANEPVIGAEAQRRRDRALAILRSDPARQIAVIAEPGDPAHVVVAVRGVAVGELTIPADRYDSFALLALMHSHGHA